MNDVQFSGFPEDLLHFLSELSVNNNREWFNENKPRYRQSVVAPVCDFIAAMADELALISPKFLADPRPNGGSMFRIYRDTRFSKDKRPYKENVGCHFRHSAGNSAHGLGFYLHIQPNNSFAGGGIWMPAAADLNKIRCAIVDRPGDWKAVLNNELLLRRFGVIEGESLQRPPKGFDAEFVFIDDLKRKSFFVQQNLGDDVIRSADVVKEIAEVFNEAAPLMRFLAKALALPF